MSFVPRALLTGPQPVNGNTNGNNATAKDNAKVNGKTTNNLEEQAAKLADKYTKLDTVKPILSEFLKDTSLFNLLTIVFEHHLSMIKSRSQKLEDGEITIYDKALLKLTSNGTETYNLGALELFIDEVMGVKDNECATMDEMVAHYAHLKEMMKVHAFSPKRDIHAFKDKDETTISTHNDNPNPNHDHEPNPEPNPDELKKVEEALTRLIGLFTTAQKEYREIHKDDLAKQAVAARFLRDTAENALNYLKARNMQHYMIPELEASFQAAREKAIDLSGGRKRPFEVHEDARWGRRSRPRADCYRPYDVHTLTPANKEATTCSRYLRGPRSVAHYYHAKPRAPAPSEDTPSTNSPTPPDSQLTPEDGSSGYGDALPSRQGQQLPELGKLRTDFSEEGNDQSITRARGFEHIGSANDADDEDEDYTPEKEAEGYTYIEEPPPKSYTLDEERRVVKKFDRRLTMFMALLYMLSFLDRSNIGNARIAGLQTDLRLTSSQFEWILTAFYITYICFEWMTLMYRVVPAHIYISLCCFSWGLFAACQSLASSFWVLLFLRALLGIAEAAFGPGLPFYLSFFYKREELAYRTGMFISAAPLATSFASTLAWAIVKLSDDGPIAPWRALCLIEGFPSVIVAVFAWIYVPDSPGRARYLTPRERKVAKLRLKLSSGTVHKDRSRQRRFDWSEVGRALRDPKSYLTAFMFFSCNVAFSSMPVFLPTILKDMGYSALTSQAISAPPYFVSFLVVLLTSSLSDKRRTRSPYIITHALLSSTAYLSIALTGHFHAHLSHTTQLLIRYIAIYPAAAGFFSAITIIITWTMDNQPAKVGKGAGMAILNIIGQCGPLVGTRLYPDMDGPWYVRGMAVCSLFMLLVAGLALALRLLLQRENEQAVRGKGAAGEEFEMVEGEAAGLMGRFVSGRGPGSGAGSGSSSRAGGEKMGGSDGRFVYII
ncbi:hypothetical protein AJ79_05213 [Helicocarpus griseus UAMH5409]|uniref:Major facilitator superfamily (MFS) profile domain-containing protein n=1 Tax=Helicocarpus griseus UAMH5409 TaxID=1447875 RepID=A0A2B7XQ13_9EURO|nr:hypothetical protein AJ79_05213 [Helicocarpus griseus UAMH5409]